MKVIYKSLMNDISRAKESADRAGRTIEKIVLNKYELEELTSEARTMGLPQLGPRISKIYGIPIEEEKDD